MTILPGLLAPEVMALLEGKTMSDMITTLRSLGMWTYEDDVEFDKLMSDDTFMSRAAEYYKYRTSSDELLYICADVDEFNVLKDTEERCEGIPFEINNGQVTRRSGIYRAEVEQLLINKSREQGKEGHIFGFHKK